MGGHGGSRASGGRAEGVAPEITEIMGKIAAHNASKINASASPAESPAARYARQAEANKQQRIASGFSSQGMERLREQRSEIKRLRGPAKVAAAAKYNADLATYKASQEGRTTSANIKAENKATRAANKARKAARRARINAKYGITPGMSRSESNRRFEEGFNAQFAK